MSLLDLLDAAACSDPAVNFVDGDGHASFASLWTEAGHVAAGLAERYDPGERVGILVRTERASLVALLALWRAGVVAVSLPEAAPAELQAMAVGLGCGALIAPTSVDAADGPLPVVSAERLPARGRIVERDGGGLIQCTSGTTGAPRGARLTLDALGANVRAIAEAMDFGPGDGAVSWLPLSHDMGLVGMVLAILGGPAALGTPPIDLTLLRPERFLTMPSTWLRTISEAGATITATPNFALDVASRRVPQVDLRRLRVVVVGAEPVQAATLRRFELATVDTGFCGRALCPAYGLAEASLAVTMSRPDEPWSVLDGSDGLVSCGRPVGDLEVRLRASEGEELVEVRGASLLTGYTDGPDLRPGEWLQTGDLGHVLDGELGVIGRAGDAFKVLGRPFPVHAVERSLSEQGTPGLVVPDGSGGVALILSGRAEVARAAACVRSVGGVGATSVFRVPRRLLPRTPSGKPRRALIGRSVESGAYDEWRCPTSRRSA